ncbi:carbohydrate deacetylase isoform X4 [Hemicordylus capensis]|uniref:carbohydrate deacetylase isoform X4 n=1 Tax=Hemicordylus capensis TaxID=884348 RepID=UPI0023031297|nr:carbohydrate deacetylase isoform X4 [Hemicordylus capensis]
MELTPNDAQGRGETDRHRGRLRILPEKEPRHRGVLPGWRRLQRLPPGQWQCRGRCRATGKEVKQELTAQVILFCELTGHIPHHMDGHQHVHVLPEIRHVFAQVLKDYEIKYTRVPIEPELPRCDWIDPPLMDFYLGVEKHSVDTVDVFRKHGIRWPDIYIGLSTMGKNMSVSSILGAIDAATAAYLEKQDSSVPSSAPSDPDREAGTVTIELMTHPGYPSIPPVGGCGEGPDEFSQSWERLHELETLKDPHLQSHYEARTIRLCAFNDLGV